MKVIITESQYNRAIDLFISHLLEPHEVRTSEKYPGSIFWVKGGEVIAEIENSEYFWVWYEIWIRISEMFGLDYIDTQSVIKVWLEQHYNLGGLTPDLCLGTRHTMLEQHYNLGGLTPLHHSNLSAVMLEQHYGLGGLTPNCV